MKIKSKCIIELIVVTPQPFEDDCHKYVPAVVAFNYRLSPALKQLGLTPGVTPVLMQLGLTRKSMPTLRSHVCWEMSARRNCRFSVRPSSKGFNSFAQCQLVHRV
ncbi:hypothetical protein AVEN_243743-1 [Araneus ventricosus]|uniref:Uncharacterized protein n=1 Tax=Araneus ventricosus TaxID=182803 RepID=A0A4Y2A7M2_ARAVE|nr:hypothetical protein AVEN_243743-1 [Araneus ventricosus]